jgi:hypothetical protein
MVIEDLNWRIVSEMLGVTVSEFQGSSKIPSAFQKNSIRCRLTFQKRKRFAQ